MRHPPTSTAFAATSLVACITAILLEGFVPLAAAARPRVEPATETSPSSLQAEPMLLTPPSNVQITRLPPIEPSRQRPQEAVENPMASKATAETGAAVSIIIPVPVRVADMLELQPPVRSVNRDAADTASIPSFDRGPGAPSAAAYLSQVNRSTDTIVDNLSPADRPLTDAERSALELPVKVAGQVSKIMAEATQLADRGALFAARNRFLRVLRMVTQTMDAQIGRSYHTRALARGLRALEEAGDFASTSNFVEADVHLSGFIAGHDTPVLKDVDAAMITPLTAMRAYYDYAHQQLVQAGGNNRIASEALFAMGRAETLIGFGEKGKPTNRGTKAMALYNAALAVDDTNSQAANELAVMLVRGGHDDHALEVLERIVQKAPSPSTLQNLANLHSRAGRQQMSRQITTRYQQLAQISGTRESSVGQPKIQWVDPKTFDELPSGVDSVSHTEASLQPPPLPRPLVTKPTHVPYGTAVRPAAAEAPKPGNSKRWW